MARVHGDLSEDTLRQAYRRLQRKGAIIMACYLASYVFLLVASGWIAGILACIAFALCMVAVGFNIQHDANHNAFFRTKGSRFSMPNRIAGLSIHMIGGNSKRWIDGHVFRHHGSPNVVGKDYDIELAPFARLAPAQKRHAWHAMQHFYLWVIYAFTSISLMIGDMVGIVQDSFEGDRTGKAPRLRDYVELMGSKLAFFAAVLVIPLLRHPWWIVLLGTLLVLGISGFLLGVVFQLAHAVEEADFDESSQRTKVRWHEWQVRASVDFCHGHGLVARVLTWYAGGLNFQTEHHLFPQLPHTVYPYISPIVAETCAEFGIRYHVQPTLRAAIRSHYRHVRELGLADPEPAGAPVAEAA